MGIIVFNNEDIIYEVNEKKGTVTAYIKSYAIVKDSKIGTALAALVVNDIKLPTLPDVFAAVARCKQGDTFNVEKGKRVARLKLLRKITQAERTYIRYIFDKFTAITKTVTTGLENYQASYMNRLNNLCAYLDKE